MLSSGGEWEVARFVPPTVILIDDHKSYHVTHHPCYHHHHRRHQAGRESAQLWEVASIALLFFPSHLTCCKYNQNHATHIMRMFRSCYFCVMVCIVCALFMRLYSQNSEPHFSRNVSNENLCISVYIWTKFLSLEKKML